MAWAVAGKANNNAISRNGVLGWPFGERPLPRALVAATDLSRHPNVFNSSEPELSRLNTLPLEPLIRLEPISLLAKVANLWTAVHPVN